MRNCNPSILICFVGIAWRLSSLCCKCKFRNAISVHLLRISCIVIVLKLSDLSLRERVLQWLRLLHFFRLNYGRGLVVARYLLSRILFQDLAVPVWLIMLIQYVWQLVLDSNTFEIGFWSTTLSFSWGFFFLNLTQTPLVRSLHLRYQLRVA